MWPNGAVNNANACYRLELLFWVNKWSVIWGAIKLIFSPQIWVKAFMNVWQKMQSVRV
jgi:hypothetical protein